MSDIFEKALKGDRGEDQGRIAEMGLQWIELLLCKNADYGSSAWKAPVLCPNTPAKAAILVRMSDKIQRLQSLQQKMIEGEGPEVAETFDDTIRDLGAYCLLYLSAPKQK